MTRKAEDRVVVYAAVIPAACLIYVGATKNYGIRCSQHRRDLERSKHVNKQMQEAFDRGGRDIVFEVLERVEDLTLLRDREQEWLDALFEALPGKVLNRSASAKDNSGVVYTDEAKARMSAAQKGRKKTDEQREKNRQATLRRWRDPAVRARYVEAAIDRTPDRERDELGRWN